MTSIVGNKMKTLFELKMRRIIIFAMAIISIAMICLGFNYFSNLGNTSAVDQESISYPTLTNAQKMVQEVAMAYYRRGTTIQYEDKRRNTHMTPEDITVYSTAHHVCSGFTQAVYYEAFGMFIPQTAQRLHNYLVAHYTGSDAKTDGTFMGFKNSNENYKDVVFAGDNPFLTLSPNDTEEYIPKFHAMLEMLQVGDIIVWSQAGGSTGHVMMVYDFKKNNEGKRIDAILIDSAANGQFGDHVDGGKRMMALGVKANLTAWVQSEKITDDDKKINLRDENARAGTIQFREISFEREHKEKGKINEKDVKLQDDAQLAIYRPLAYITQGKYRKYDGNNHTASDNLVNISSEKLRVSQSRLDYSGIRIQKINDVANGSIVGQGDKISYTLTIENMSDNDYSGLKVVENIPTGLVEIIEKGDGDINGDTLVWDNIGIPAKTFKHIKYSVRVKTDSNLEGREIISTGLVANIPSTTITNKIGRNLNSNKQTEILEAFEDEKSSTEGLELIDNTYKHVFGDKYDLDLLSINFGEHYNSQRYKTGSENYIEENEVRKCNPYTIEYIDTVGGGFGSAGSKESNNDALILTNSTRKFSGIKINNYHSLAKGIVNRYYNALSQYTEHIKNSDNNYILSCTDAVTPYYYTDDSFSNDITTPDRSDRINVKNLQIGDVLIYANKPFTDKQLENQTMIRVLFENSSGLEGAYGNHSVKDEIKNLFNDNGIFAYIWNGKSFIGNNGNHQEPTETTVRTKTGYDAGGEPIFNDDKCEVDLDIIWGSYDERAKGDCLNNLSLLFGKDYYVILRPSLLMDTREKQPISFTNGDITKKTTDPNFIVRATTTGIGDITYSSKYPNIATVNQTTGEVTIKGAGTTTITATAAQTVNNLGNSTSYTLTINKASQAVEFSDNNSSITKNIGSANFTNPATTTGDGTITYSSSNTNVATINSVTGEIAIHAAGTTTITATASSTDKYNENSATFTLNVEEPTKQNQTVTFATSSVITKTYGDINFTNPATTTGDGAITYSSSNTNVATINSVTGEIAIHSAGSTTITATAANTDSYNAASNSFELTVSKKTSNAPAELSSTLNGLTGDKLSTILLNTSGLEWSNEDEAIRSGDYLYNVKYTENNDKTNYTTESFQLTVHGTPKTYHVISGNNQIITIGSDTDPSFTIDADYSLFENDGKVYIDGNLLDSSNYTSTSGSTIITLSNDYVASLDTGSHTMLVQFSDEGTAEASFSAETIEDSDPDEVVYGDDSSDDESSQVPPESDNPDPSVDPGTDPNSDNPDAPEPTEEDLAVPDTGANSDDPNIDIALISTTGLTIFVVLVGLLPKLHHHKITFDK